MSNWPMDLAKRKKKNKKNKNKKKHMFVDEEMIDKTKSKSTRDVSDKMMDVEMSANTTNSTSTSDSSDSDEINNNNGGSGKYVYRDTFQLHKKAFHLMWNVIELLEFDGTKNVELCKAFLTVIKDNSMKEFSQAMSIWSMTHLRVLFYTKFLSNPILCFTSTQHLLSTLLENAAYVRNQLGEILEKLEADIMEVAATDIMELIHTFDMQYDDCNLTQMMKKWICLLTNTSRPGTQLHQFVNSRLEDYIQFGEKQKRWKKLQAKVKQWEQRQYTDHP